MNMIIHFQCYCPVIQVNCLISNLETMFSLCTWAFVVSYDVISFLLACSLITCIGPCSCNTCIHVCSMSHVTCCV